MPYCKYLTSILVNNYIICARETVYHFFKQSHFSEFQQFQNKMMFIKVIYIEYKVRYQHDAIDWKIRVLWRVRSPETHQWKGGKLLQPSCLSFVINRLHGEKKLLSVNWKSETLRSQCYPYYFFSVFLIHVTLILSFSAI